MVGSGKSTLFQVILGELELDAGSVKVNGKLSYASQESWLFEGSIRQNILFVEEFEEERYLFVVCIYIFITLYSSYFYITLYITTLSADTKKWLRSAH